jgi:hypothetical protein
MSRKGFGRSASPMKSTTPESKHVGDLSRAEVSSAGLSKAHEASQISVA